MAFIVGITLALSISALAKLTGFDRDKAFYPTLVAVVASYYVLFAVMGGSMPVLLTEAAIVALFLLAAFIGFRVSLWFAVAGLAGHGVLDFFHTHLVSNPGVPIWWPSFCGAYDIVAAGFLATLLQRSTSPAKTQDTGLELMIPPPLVWAGIADLMWLTSLVSTPYHFSFSARLPVALGISVLALAIAIAGVVLFQRARTTVNPTRPGSASTLVVSGVYQFTRNPMYLGLLLLLVAWGVVVANALALIWIPAFIGYMNRFQIAPEERALSRLFSQDFPAYKAKVRRWL